MSSKKVQDMAAIIITITTFVALYFICELAFLLLISLVGFGIFMYSFMRTVEIILDKIEGI